MNKAYLKRGFTLIELLVVIGIIGIFAAVVLAALNNSRNKGSAGKIHAQLVAARSQGEIYYNTTGNGSYGPAFAAGNCSIASSNMLGTNANNVSKLITAITAIVGASNTQCAIGNTTEVSGLSNNSGSWAISAQDPSSPTYYYCVDSSNASKRTQFPSGVAASITVNASKAQCS